VQDSVRVVNNIFQRLNFRVEVEETKMNRKKKLKVIATFLLMHGGVLLYCAAPYATKPLYIFLVQLAGLGVTVLGFFTFFKQLSSD